MVPAAGGGTGAHRRKPEEAPITTAHRTAVAPARSSHADDHRALLLSQRQMHLDQIDGCRLAVRELLDGDHLADLPGDDDSGEGDGVNVERDRLRALAAAARKSLEEVDAALARFDAGTYGLCARCGDPIPAARLEALPEATHCVGCKSGGLRRAG